MSQRTVYPAYPQRVPTRITFADRLRAVGAAAVILALVVALPVLLIATFPAVFPDWLLTQTGAQIVLFGGDLQRVALVLFYVGAWIFCLWFAWAVLTEIVTQSRNLRRPHLAPVPAGIVGRLVAVLLAAAPVPAAFAQPSAAVDVAAPAAETADAETGAEAPTANATSEAKSSRPDPSSSTQLTGETSARPSQPSVEPYVVRENDTLWGLALDRLGDGRRYQEIYELNRDVIGPRPDDLRPGTRIVLPAAPAAQPTESDSEPGGDVASSYTVQPGDTLSAIAKERLGDAQRYPEIAEASASTVQPDGDRLTDPDHIEPGWKLTIPAAAEFMSDGGRTTEHEGAADSSAETESTAAPEDADAPIEPSMPKADADAASEDHASTDTADEAEIARGQVPAVRPGHATTLPDQEADTPTLETAEASETADPSAPWLLAGVASGAGLLAADLAGIVIRGRTRQAKFRRPGRMIPPIPEDLLPVAATARIVGTRRVPDLRRLDLLLRQLAGPYLRQFTSQRPRLVAVELTDDTAILHLAEPADLPAPWHGSGVRWSAPLDAAPEKCPELIPYPMLVTVGQDDDGHAWLLDLERLRVVTITGSDEDVARFARHVVAELAMNPWTINLTTDTIGAVAPGARHLSDFRVEEHDDGSAFTSLTDDLREASENDVNSEDIEWYHAVVTAADRCDDLTDLAKVITEDPGRNGVAILVLGVRDDAPFTGQRLEIRDGRLVLPGLDVEVEAVHLRQEELDASVRLSRLMADSTDVAVPINPNARGWRAFVDEAGTPRPELAEPRPAPADAVAGDRSILPAATTVYLEMTPATVDDLGRIAPVVPIAADEDDVDPTLDEDLADWEDPQCTRPKVKVLGPIAMRGAGPMTKVSDKMPTMQAVLGYIALHPEGVINSQIAAMAGVEPSNVRTKLSDLRSWLGDRPDGTPWLPVGEGGRPSKKRPPYRFRIDGCLVDADLFLRLKARAYRRGAAGIDDLVLALDLVRGKPFTLPKPDVRWLWATEGEHLDAILTAAIADVAEIAIARAVVEGDLALAHKAHTIGTSVDPDCESLAACLAMLELAEGHPERARDIAIEILKRRDDAEPNEDMDRLARILRRVPK